MIGLLLNLWNRQKCFAVYYTNGYYSDLKACYQVDSEEAAAKAFDGTPEYAGCVRQRIKQCTDCNC